MTKYASIAASHIFTPIAAETLGPLNVAAAEFLSEHWQPYLCHL
jgi:hypothetical protein